MNVLKRITISIIAGANIATVLLMMICAYSSYINPTIIPYAASLGLIFPFFLLLNILYALF